MHRQCDHLFYPQVFWWNSGRKLYTKEANVDHPIIFFSAFFPRFPKNSNFYCVQRRASSHATHNWLNRRRIAVRQHPFRYKCRARGYSSFAWKIKCFLFLLRRRSTYHRLIANRIRPLIHFYKDGSCWHWPFHFLYQKIIGNSIIKVSKYLELPNRLTKIWIFFSRSRAA